MKTKILLTLLLIFYFSCNKNESNNVNIAIDKLLNNYPEILDKNIASWKLVRSVKNGDYNFEIQLLEENNKEEDPQKIIVFINSKMECIAIPFFSNTYRDFWEFKHEKVNSKIKKTNTTFTKEYSKALKDLRLDENLIFGVVTNELIYSILNCKEIKEKDDTPLNAIFFNSNKNFETENSFEIQERLKLNYAEMKKDIIECDKCNKVYAYLDDSNFRIYQFIFSKKVKKKKQQIIVKSYRQDQIGNYIYL